jgi:hypothetical protein
MSHCFVIQPFDGGPFDKRFDDVLVPAIENAGLKAYRVDRDPTVTILVDAIETRIRDARACLADITTDNPNVWFELGYALACGKPLVMICSSARSTKFPFDVQHRHIISYTTDSTSDFAKLRAEITERLQGALAKESKVQSLAQASLRDTEGLEPHEIAALIIIAESDLDPESFPSAYGLRQDMARAGFNDLATVLAVNTLGDKMFVRSTEVAPFNGDSYTGYCLTDAGRTWLFNNRQRLVLTAPTKSVQKSFARQVRVDDFEDFPNALADAEDDLPF